MSTSKVNSASTVVEQRVIKLSLSPSQFNAEIPIFICELRELRKKIHKKFTALPQEPLGDFYEMVDREIECFEGSVREAIDFLTLISLRLSEWEDETNSVIGGGSRKGGRYE